MRQHHTLHQESSVRPFDITCRPDEAIGDKVVPLIRPLAWWTLVGKSFFRSLTIGQKMEERMGEFQLDCTIANSI